MAGSMSNYWEKKVLDHLFGKSSYTPPANIYVGVSTADPLDDGSGLAEPSGGSYARVQTAPADWNAAVEGAPTLIDNANAIQFPEASGDWGTITHFALFDAATDGNMLAHGSLSVAKPISEGDTLQFAAGDLDVTQD
jgi:hypothetical protein